MDTAFRIEKALTTVLERGEQAGAPPKLAAAIRYAVFPGGARIRPRLCLAVAKACGDDHPEVTDAAAAAIELLHCASLVHDDLPCFDDAATRRGKPSVHLAYGEAQAVLAGDALIVAAFEALAHGGIATPERLPSLITTISRSVGMPFGIVAGQAWECEPTVALTDYHRAKTGSLFAAATAAGAIASGGSAERWRTLGACIGEAYQVADDLHDKISDPDKIGKPCGQDAAHGRPSAVVELGFPGAIKRLRDLIAEAIGSIPPCPGRAELEAAIAAQAKRFVPSGIERYAA